MALKKKQVFYDAGENVYMVIKYLYNYKYFSISEGVFLSSAVMYLYAAYAK